MPIDHKEVAFETAVEEHLLDAAGYAHANPADFDRERAVDPNVFLAFLQQSQRATWEALEKLHGAGTATIVLDDLSKALDGTAGSLGVLRHGFKCFGKRIDAAYFAPAHGMNPENERLSRRRLHGSNAPAASWKRRRFRRTGCGRWASGPWCWRPTTPHTSRAPS